MVHIHDSQIHTLPSHKRASYKGYGADHVIEFKENRFSKQLSSQPNLQVLGPAYKVFLQKQGGDCGVGPSLNKPPIRAIELRICQF